jgi:hypothetical protein
MAGALAARIHGSALLPSLRGGGAAKGRIVTSLAGAGRVTPHSIGSIFSGLSAAGLATAITNSLVSGFFHALLGWVASGAASLVGVLAKALSSSTTPVLTASAFGSEFDLMATLSAAVALPLVAVGAIQAIVRQEPGGLIRSVLVRLPLALLFTGVSVQIVALGITATDQASAMVIGANGDPAKQLLAGLVTTLGQPGSFGLAAFGSFILVLCAGIVAFLLWLELAVRSAAIAAASLFLPLALVGLAWPATSHWARRLGETLAALVISKFAIASVLALAAGLLLSSSGLASVVQGVALLAIAAFAPFALLKLVPVVEAGAISHLDGLGRRPLRAAQSLGTEVLGLEGGGVAALAGLGGVAAGLLKGQDGGTGGSALPPFGESRFENSSTTEFTGARAPEPDHRTGEPAASYPSAVGRSSSSGAPSPSSGSGGPAEPVLSGAESPRVSHLQTPPHTRGPDHG